MPAGVRARTKLTQAEFAARIGVPVETVRNWEQGKRSPRGPARALLKVIDKAPDVAFAVLAQGPANRPTTSDRPRKTRFGSTDRSSELPCALSRARGAPDRQVSTAIAARVPR